MATSDPVLKGMLPFLQRADELQKHDTLMAYYCRMYALEKALEFDSKSRSKDAEGMLRAVLNQLEKDKKILKTSPDDSVYVEGFALNVFNKADKQDRAGRADKDTAKAFYAASLFMEICRQFDSNRDLKPEIEEKLKYAVWKAGDIRKALVQGRTPTPGPPGSVSIPTDEELERELAADTGTSYGGGAGRSSDGVPTDEFGLPLVPTGGTTVGPSPSAAPSFPPSTSVHTDEFGFPIAPGASGAALTRGPSFSPRVPEGQQPPGQSGPPSGTYSVISGAPPDGGTPAHAVFGMPPPSAPTSFPSAAASSSSSLYPPASTAPQYPQHGPSTNVGSSAQQPFPPSSAPPLMPSSSSYSYPSAGGTQPPPFNYSAPPPASTAPPSSMGFMSQTPQTVAAAPPPSKGRGRSFPPPDRVSEAHKAARSAVSALGFDDVNTGIEYLQRALDLLTKP